MRLNHNFKILPLESQIVFLISCFAFVRIVIALVKDFDTGLAYHVMLIDFGFLVLVSFLTILSWRGAIHRISVLVGVLITLLLAFNFLQFGGVSGYTKFNYYVGLYMIVVLYARWKLKLVVTFHLVILFIILVLDYIHHPLVQSVFLHIFPQSEDFWFSILMVSGFGYYLKNQTDLFSQNLFLLNSDLAERIKLARRLNKLMQEKNEELLEAQQFLEKEIQKRSEVLEKKNNSIEQFMMVNTSHLVDPVKDLIDTVREKESVSVLSVLLRQSADDLEKVSYSIREAIQTHPLINRQNIK